MAKIRYIWGAFSDFARVCACVSVKKNIKQEYTLRNDPFHIKAMPFFFSLLCSVAPKPVIKSILVKSKYTLLVCVLNMETLPGFTFLANLYQKARYYLGALTKTTDFYPDRGKLAGFIVPCLGTRSEISVFWKLSHKSTFVSPSQLWIVTDDHKCLHQSISMQAVRPTRTDMTYPLLFHYSQRRRRMISELRQKDDEQHFSLPFIYTSESPNPRRC